jgi:hypothetical protein
MGKIFYRGLTFNALLQNNERTHKYDADAARGENARTNNNIMMPICCGPRMPINMMRMVLGQPTLSTSQSEQQATMRELNQAAVFCYCKAFKIC